MMFQNCSFTIKRTQSLVFSCECSKIFLDSFFTEHLEMIASKNHKFEKICMKFFLKKSYRSVLNSYALTRFCLSEVFFLPFHIQHCESNVKNVSTEVPYLYDSRPAKFPTQNHIQVNKTKHEFNTTQDKCTVKKVCDSMYLKVVTATFLLVCFISLKGSTCEARKSVFLFYFESSFRS